MDISEIRTLGESAHLQISLMDNTLHCTFPNVTFVVIRINSLEVQLQYLNFSQSGEC